MQGFGFRWLQTQFLAYIVGDVRSLTAAVEQNTHRHRFVLIFTGCYGCGGWQQNALLATRRRSCSLSCWGFCIRCTDSRFAIWDLSLRFALRRFFLGGGGWQFSASPGDRAWQIDWWCLRLQFIQFLSHWSTKCSFFKHIKHLSLRLRMSLLAYLLPCGKTLRNVFQCSKHILE